MSVIHVSVCGMPMPVYVSNSLVAKAWGPKARAAAKLAKDRKKGARGENSLHAGARWVFNEPDRAEQHIAQSESGAPGTARRAGTLRDVKLPSVQRYSAQAEASKQQDINAQRLAAGKQRVEEYLNNPMFGHADYKRQLIYGS